MPDNQTYSFDTVFDKDANQETVYNTVGNAMVQDVLKGYNGTILAYGPTGSGKTYTMFGEDVYDQGLCGVIPRAAADIFKSWETSNEVKEVGVCCSMVEIYKENLHDLLADVSAGLKIKESPSRGIYVDGLCEIPIVSAQELLYYIDLGEARRAWAETRHNHVSSRSHSIFILEVRQSLFDDTETRGILNLVDLAGSEKVGKSGAQGQIFEEGTKINLSLSALGNVIHALVSNVEHIPYRDSKLTRLLQESLGGNYKTSLIITCSPHSSQLSETISSLKFAQRAKHLRNNVTVNVKRSPDQLAKLVEDLRSQLKRKDGELRKMKLLISGKNSLQKFIPPILDEEDEYPKTVDLLEVKRCKSILKEQVDEDSVRGTAEILNLENKSQTPSNKSSTVNVHVSIDDPKKYEVLVSENKELRQKVKDNEIELIEAKKKIIELERTNLELEHELEKLRQASQKDIRKTALENTEIMILRNQLKALSEALEDTETECARLLKEKKEKVEKDTTELCNLNMLDIFHKDSEKNCLVFLVYFNKFIKFGDKWIKDLELLGMNTSAYLGLSKKFSGTEDLNYAAALDEAILGRNVSAETMNYLLKNLVTDSFIINNYLRRTISFLVWKLQIEKTAVNIKGEIGNALQTTVDSLEDIMARSNSKHLLLKKKLEELDYEIEQLKKIYENTQFPHPSKSGPLSRTKIIKPLRKDSLRGLKPLNIIQASAFNLPRKFSEQRILPLSFVENAVAGVNRISEVDELKEQDAVVFKIENTDRNGNETPIVKKDDSEMVLSPGTRKMYQRSTFVADTFKDCYAEVIESHDNKKREKDSIEEELKDAQNEMMWHKALSNLLMEEVVKSRDQGNALRKQINEIKESSEKLIEDENKKWQLITDSLKVYFY